MNLEVEALSIPSKQWREHRGLHTYNCHMAAIYWALRARGKTQEQAEDLVDAITKQSCLGCKGIGPGGHASLDNGEYGRLFCGDAQPWTLNMAQVGDVMLIGPKQAPAHSMIVVQTNANRTLIRAYNNAATFRNGAPENDYDNQDRDISDRVHPIPGSLFLIRNHSYLAKVAQVAQLMKVHALSNMGVHRVGVK